MLEVYLSNQSNIRVELPVLKKMAVHVLKNERRERAELSITLVKSEVIRELNNRYRGVDVPTDVLAFNLEDEGEDRIWGEIIIAPEIAGRQAKEYGTSFDRELKLLLTHGILHLLGYDHDTESSAELMERRQQELLGSFEGTAA